MPTKTTHKVSPRVKRYSPVKFVLNELLRPGYYADKETFVQMCMKEFNMCRSEALKVVCNAYDSMDRHGLTWHDRDKLNLPNISDRYPRYKEVCKHWKSRVKE